MPNSNDVAGNEMLWERVLSLLVVGASVLGGSAAHAVLENDVAVNIDNANGNRHARYADENVRPRLQSRRPLRQAG